MMNILLNLLWLFFGGWTTALSWLTCAIFMVISIVGIPWARAAFNIALLNFWPFGSSVQTRAGSDIGTGSLGTLGNILWFVFCGWWLSAVHIFWGLLFSIIIIALPWGLQHFKLAKISFAPIGKTIIFT